MMPATDDLGDAGRGDGGRRVGHDSLVMTLQATRPGIALVGTSYSANALWSFEPQLKGALGADIVNYAEEGHGPIEPMRSFMAKLEAGSISVKTVIWQVLLRYLDDDAQPVSGSSSV